MRQAIGLESYDSGTKDTWRGWQWNRIVERLPESRERLSEKQTRIACADKTVLYLCGPDDFDGLAAMKRGFSRSNLIAVDICEKNVCRIRERGGIGVVGRLERIIEAWNGRIDVVIADTCSGFGNSVIDIRLALSKSPGIHRNTIVSLNLKRGRDSPTNYIRNEIRLDPIADSDGKKSAAHMKWVDVFGCPSYTIKHPIVFDTLEDLTKARDAAVARCELSEMRLDNCKLSKEIADSLEDGLHRGKQFLYDSWIRMAYYDGEEHRKIWREMMPAFYSYKTRHASNGVSVVSVMDSVLYVVSGLHVESNIESDWKSRENQKGKNYRGMIAAAKAVRTKRTQLAK